MFKTVSILLVLFVSGKSYAQVTDYRDAFLGLYHCPLSPCINTNEQNPPNRYVLIEKDSGNSTGIFVNDTAWGQVNNNYRHPCTLNQSDSTYVDGAQLGKFIPSDSLKINTSWTCSGAVYYLHKISPIGLNLFNDKTKEWYSFPNPAVNQINILLPKVSEVLNLSLFDVNGKEFLNKEFKTQTQIDVSNLPRGVYVIRIKGIELNLIKRVVLVE